MAKDEISEDNCWADALNAFSLFTNNANEVTSHLLVTTGEVSGAKRNTKPFFLGMHFTVVKIIGTLHYFIVVYYLYDYYCKPFWATAMSMMNVGSIIRIIWPFLGKWRNEWKWLFIDELMIFRDLCLNLLPETFAENFCLVRPHKFDLDNVLQPKYHQLINK